MEHYYEDSSTKINIEHCLELDEDDNTICEYCDYNYEWDSKSKTCKSICDGWVEELCDKCDDNYHLYDYGKTCKKMDLEYDGDYGDDDEEGDKNGSNKDADSDDEAKFMKFDLIIVGLILCLVL